MRHSKALSSQKAREPASGNVRSSPSQCSRMSRAAHMRTHVTRVTAGSNTAPDTQVQLVTKLSSFYFCSLHAALFTCHPSQRRRPCRPRHAGHPAMLFCAPLCNSDTCTTPRVIQQKPGGTNQSFSARLQPDGVGEALLLVPLLISDCVLKNASANELPQQANRLFISEIKIKCNAPAVPFLALYRSAAA